MNDSTVNFAFIVGIFTWIILFGGEPDIADGIIHWLMK